ncbi:MAG: hypothetical protein G01um101472_438 [Parcubacteria group bacterium Gr01-1014_72]|nr:MAG: hypothetical protein G01um101472_438 [Parcubacteria group bacterium Gr01-1014_72]
MSGHNRWTQIKRKKERSDATKGRVFSKYAKLITNEARAAKGNREAPALRAAIERARKENMPNDNIERAIKKATEKGAAMESAMYEAYGPGGIALIIDVLTDSKNRASQEIKAILARHGASLASPGSALWAFTKTGHDTNMRMGTNDANGERVWKPTTTIALSDEDLAKLGKLVDELLEQEDVQEVVTNAE